MAQEESKKVWFGTDPKECDICEGPITDEFVDGKLRGQVAWGVLCPGCHKKHGVGLGLGKGQKYQKAPDGSWPKVEG